MVIHRAIMQKYQQMHDYISLMDTQTFQHHHTHPGALRSRRFSFVTCRLKPHGPTSASAALPVTEKFSISLLCWQQSGRSWPSPAAPKDPEDPLDHPLSERRTATTPQQHISSMAEMVRTIMYSDREERWCLEMWNSDLQSPFYSSQPTTFCPLQLSEKTADVFLDR